MSIMAKLRNEKSDAQENVSIAELKEVQDAVRAQMTTPSKTPPEEIIKKYDRLVIMANVWNDAYWDDNPVVPDEVYDQLVQLIHDIELMIPSELLNKKSPNNVIGSRVNDDNNITHTQPMLSLKRASDHYTVHKALQSMQKALDRGFKNCPMGIDYNKGYVLEPKLDGVALEVVYVKNRSSYQRFDFASASLRGNGKEGMDVTHIAKEMESIPSEIFIDPDKFDGNVFTVYGEVCVHTWTAQRIAKYADGTAPEKLSYDWESYTGVKGEDDISNYASLRHLASAIMRSKTTELAKQYDPVFVAYETSRDCYFTNTRLELKQALKSLGFKTIDVTLAVGDDIGLVCSTAMREAQVDFDGIRFREEKNSSLRECGFQTDGIVIKLNSLDACCRVGDNGKKPHWALAVKQPMFYQETTLEDLTWTIGRQGALTPIAWVKPVTLNGVVCSKVKFGSLHQVKTCGLGIGDKVVVVLSGDAVPTIYQEFHPDIAARKAFEENYSCLPWNSPIKSTNDLPAAKSEKLTLPTHCPCCNTELKGHDKMQLVCPNTKGCEDQIVARLVHFASSDAVNIRYVGEQIIRSLVKDAGFRLPSDLADIAVEDLDMVNPPIHRDKLGTVRAIRSKIATTIDEQPARIIFGLSTPGVGKALAEELIGVYGNIQSLLLRTPESIASTIRCRLSTAEEMLKDLKIFMESDVANAGDVQSAISKMAHVLLDKHLNKNAVLN